MPEDFDDDFEQISDQEVLDYSPSQPSKNSKIINSGKKDNRNIVNKTRDTAGTVVDDVGKGVQTAGNVTQVAGKGTQVVGKGMQVAGKGTELAGKGAQVAGKGVQTAGKGVDAAGDAALNAGKALSSTGLGAIAGVPIMAVGAAGKGVGKTTEVAGKGTETAGKGAEKAGKAINEAGKKVDKTGKKIENTGKNISNKGKDISDTGNRIKSSTRKSAKQPNVVDNTIDKAGKEIKKKTIKDILSKFDISKKIEESIDPMKKSLNSFKKWVKRSIIIVVLIVLFFPTIIYILFSPILEAMQWMNEKLDDAIEITQKGVNFYNGFGLQTTKEAFYEELDYLYEEYDHQIDIPLIMATLFYKEREGYDTSFNFDPEIDDGIEGLDVASQKEEIKNWLSEKYESVFSTLDEDGKNYTIGKIYRLRKLAKNQMDSQLFGTAAPSQEEEVTFSDFLERSKSRLSDDVYQALQGLAAENPIAALPQTISKIHELTQINDGNEIWATTSFGNESEAALGLQNLLKEVLITATEIKSIRYADGGFKVIIYKYNYSEDNFKNYLKKYYIRYMPEFKEDVGRLSDSAKEEAIDNIISEIYEYSDEYKEIFGYSEPQSAEDEIDECIGNVNLEIIPKLASPIKERESYSFEGSDAYGISNGKTNNGVDLTESSAEIKEGEDVYAIADGTVEEVVSDLDCNIGTDPNCSLQGNYIIIKHDVIKSDEGASYKLKSVYTNLQKNSNKFKVGDRIKKGKVIGRVGKTGDATEAKLHFELHDVSDGDVTLNPTNLFNKCPEPTERENGDGTDFPLRSTCLTRSQFIEKMNGACSKITCSDSMKNIFVPNAGKIYDASKRNNINPELIVVRAINEGFSPGKSKNNYWGIGCYNGCDTCCITYSSLENGIKGFANLKIVKDAKNIEEMMSSYAYIGSNWYNPGSWSNGGCIYFKEIKQYMSPSRAAKVAAACAPSKTCSGNSCMKTTDEDQKAYTKWQVEKNLTPYRKQIFGDSCSGSRSNSSGGGGSSTKVELGGQTSAKGKSKKDKIKLLYPNGVPKNESEAKKYIVDVTVPITTKSGKKSTTTVQVHKALKNDVIAALTAAQNEGFRVYEIGGYGRWNSDGSCDAAGSNKDVGLQYSQHCYGLAVDINVNENCYKKPPSAGCSVGNLYSPNSNRYSIKKDGALYKSFIGNGWGWGGEWNSLKDYMHFSFFGT